MLEKIILNNADYKYRQENNDQLLIYNVITAEMIFLSGNTKKYIENILYKNSQDVQLSEKYMKYLISNNIIIREDF